MSAWQDEQYEKFRREQARKHGLPEPEPETKPTPSPPMQRQPVIIKDIQMPFGSMVVFMVKWAIASIPAAIILGLLVYLILGFLTLPF